MNPPPLPRDPNKKTWAHHAAAASILCPLLLILLAIAAATMRASQPGSPAAATVMGITAMVLMVAGFAFGIAALCAMARFGREGILGKAIGGLLFNGLFLAIFMTGFISGINRAAHRRQANIQTSNSVERLRTELRDSYDPKLGMTNVSAGSRQLTRLREDLDKASQNLSGEDLLIHQAMASHMQRLQVNVAETEAVGKKFKEAEVLRVSNLTDKAQIESRRAVVREFLAVNNRLWTTVTNAETRIRADLEAAQISPTKVEAAMQGFSKSHRPRQKIIVQIRQCEHQIGNSILGVLNVLESQWGAWTVPSAEEKVLFKGNASAIVYNKYITEINKARDEEVKLQGELLKLK